MWAGSQTEEKGRRTKEEVKRKEVAGEKFGGRGILLPQAPLMNSTRSL